MKRLKTLQIVLVSVLTGLVCVCFSTTVFADEYHIVWAKNFGGGAGDFFNSSKVALRHTQFGPVYIAVGCSDEGSFGHGDWTGVAGKGSGDAIIVRFADTVSSGCNPSWKKNFGGSGGDWFCGVTDVSDGYIAVGQSQAASFGTGDWEGVTGKGGIDAIIVKFDLNGDVVWKKNFGGSAEDRYEVITEVPNGVVVVGHSFAGSFGNGDWADVTGKGGSMDAIIVKYDYDGNVIWKKNFGGASVADIYYWVTDVSDGVIASGVSASFGTGDWIDVEGKGGSDAILVKYDYDGNVIWKKNFGGAGLDDFISVTAIPDGIVAVGLSGFESFGNGDWEGFSGNGKDDAILVKYDNDGNIVWKRHFGGNDREWFWAATTVSDGIAAVGVSGANSFNNGDWTGIMGKGGNDVMMVKYDHDGNMLWRQNFGGSGNDDCIWATETSDGFVMAGSSAASSFGTGDWEDVPGKGGYDATIMKFAPYIATYIPVTDIINVPKYTKVGVPLTLSGQVVPGNATYQVFSWELLDAGETGATLDNGNVLNTTDIGTVVVKAIIENGADFNVPFTKDFIIAVNPPDFVPVTDIKEVPTSTTVTIPLTLTGTVVPENATNQAIVWSLTDPGATGATINNGNTLNTTDIGTVIVTATIAGGIGLEVDYVEDFIIAVNPEGFVPVTDIINVPVSTVVTIPLTLTGMVVPSNANYKDIVWSLKSMGTTGATLDGDTLHTLTKGTVIVTATIENGAGIGIPFIKDFTIGINPEDFVPIIEIVDVPTTATIKIPLPLSGTVIPEEATNKTPMIWTVSDAGTTGAYMSGNYVLNTKTSGTVIVKVSIANGTGIGVPYTQEFTIEVEDNVTISELPQSDAPLKAYAKNGILYVSGLTVGKIWQVYNILGELVYEGVATSEDANTPLPVSGMYIIRSEEKGVKVITYK